MTKVRDNTWEGVMNNKLMVLAVLAVSAFAQQAAPTATAPQKIKIAVAENTPAGKFLGEQIRKANYEVVSNAAGAPYMATATTQKGRVRFQIISLTSGQVVREGEDKTPEKAWTNLIERKNESGWTRFGRGVRNVGAEIAPGDIFGQPGDDPRTAVRREVNRQAPLVGEPTTATDRKGRVTKVWTEPAPKDEEPNQYADHRPTLAVVLRVQGRYTSWMSDAERQNMLNAAHELFSRRFQILQGYNNPDLKENMGETEFSNSQWVASDQGKTIGSMQAAQYQAVITIAMGDLREEHNGFSDRDFSSNYSMYYVEAQATIQITAVNNRAVVESGQGAGNGRASNTNNISFSNRGSSGNVGGTNSNGSYEAGRKASVNALINAHRDLHKL